MKQCLKEVVEDWCEIGRQAWGRMAECWLNANTPPADDVILAPEDYDPVATFAFMGQAIDDSETDTRAFRLMMDITAVLSAAVNEEPEQHVGVFAFDQGETFIFQQETP